MTKIDTVVDGQARVGTTLAFAVIAAWVALHVLCVFVVDWGAASILPFAVLAIAVQCWLSVGLFIVAHDAMHGSLVPGSGRWNHAIGQLALALYAGFSFARLNAKHHKHHDHAGTGDDPDFDPTLPQHFWHWYGRFIGEYFGWREYATITAMFVGYVLVTGADPWLVFIFWGLPSMLASLQLFYFGTYLPHRIDEEPFSDRHRTRSNEYSWIASLLTCFHFGYHHEHHEFPYIPWWRLPSVRRVVLSEPVESAGHI